MTASKTGSCLCGAVKYTITGVPEHYYLCHCNSCQKATGSAFGANCWYKQSELQITQGNHSITTYQDKTTESGNALQRSFCTTCGSNLFIGNDAMDKLGAVSVTSGTIDDQSGLRPTLEVWGRGRREWLSPVEGADGKDTQ
ncbi:DUF636 domain protein [Aspergillus campestris IBT 28561]|uniref:DUF636 domain protein n=1 Tax=Aspergillus campestris (strain IBT 28561) TaxID=1392248 RepID=A0A2I1CVX5_ASPC2|nr:DUF636 domain protein [Aspergillus campestris IBT 28561]PKY01783.1 DUF636 domain protein [Aspergillus campestris IBT 28561]